MNRHERRKRESQSRRNFSHEEAEKAVAGARWKQRVDPDDPSYSLIELRLPISDPTSYPETEYAGRAAYERLIRFLHSFMAGVRDGMSS